jgi:osmotically-inducible protein OsmY
VALGAEHVLADSDRSFEGAARDAWITGKIETVYTLNQHLNPFSIDTDVENGVVHLSGTVKTDIDRDLAIELAKGIEGVVKVENDLEVGTQIARTPPDSKVKSSHRRDFGSWVDDATTTAAVKSKLIANANTKGLQIDVDTSDDVVTLSGRVKSDAEKTLAEEITRNTSDVEEVRNNLVVDPS